MKVVLQRVHWAKVEVDKKVVGRIEQGLLVYVGIGCGDSWSEGEKLAKKVAAIRIFEDEDGKMNRSVRDARGGVLAVPNFTLMADARKGRRPAFTQAAPPEVAQPLFEKFLANLAESGCRVAGGIFGSEMIIRSAADGPVNIILEIPGPGETCDCSQEVKRSMEE